MSNWDLSRRQFCTSVTFAAASALLRSDALEAITQDSVVDFPRNGQSAEHVTYKVTPFPLQRVRLLPGVFKNALDRNLQYMKSLPEDRLLHSFRLTAGLNSSAQPFGGWEAADCELRGHFCGGHYLSACALAYASTGDDEIKHRGDSLVAELAKCQAADGYLSAFPTEFFDRLRARQKVWAPFYTLHKIMAGHLDIYTLTGNEQALTTVEKMSAWVAKYSRPVPDDQWQQMLMTEYGGMGEVVANLAAVHGQPADLALAKRFDKHVFFDPLAAHEDRLKGLHVNTHIPQVIAAARIYELSGEPHYREIAQYFWDEVTRERSYANGGTSNGETWDTEPGKLSSALGPHTAEDCCAYNMMKLTRHLFAWSAQARYMDLYERLLFNHRLGTIDPDTGTTMYYYPLASGYSKIFATPFDSFWCCNGTGVEEFAKLNDSIYFHDNESIFVNLYIASEAHWPEKKLRLRQETDFPRQQGTKLTVLAGEPSNVALRLRIPYWCNSSRVQVNGRPLRAFSSPGSYLTLMGPWKNGDTIEVSLPMQLHIAPMPDDEGIQAVMYGPLVLAGKLGEAPHERWYDTPFERKYKPVPAPIIHADLHDPQDWIEADAQPLVFHTRRQSQTISLVPMAHIVHEQYAVYWNVLGKNA